MRIIKPSYEILTPLKALDAKRICKNIERAGRLAWKLEGKITATSYI